MRRRTIAKDKRADSPYSSIGTFSQLDQSPVRRKDLKVIQYLEVHTFSSCWKELGCCLSMAGDDAG